MLVHARAVTAGDQGAHVGRQPLEQIDQGFGQSDLAVRAPLQAFQVVQHQDGRRPLLQMFQQGRDQIVFVHGVGEGEVQLVGQRAQRGGDVFCPRRGVLHFLHGRRGTGGAHGNPGQAGRRGPTVEVGRGAVNDFQGQRGLADAPVAHQGHHLARGRATRVEVAQDLGDLAAPVHEEVWAAHTGRQGQGAHVHAAPFARRGDERVPPGPLVAHVEHGRGPLPGEARGQGVMTLWVPGVTLVSASKATTGQGHGSPQGLAFGQGLVELLEKDVRSPDGDAVHHAHDDGDACLGEGGNDSPPLASGASGPAGLEHGHVEVARAAQAALEPSLITMPSCGVRPFQENAPWAAVTDEVKDVGLFQGIFHVLLRGVGPQHDVPPVREAHEHRGLLGHGKGFGLSLVVGLQVGVEDGRGQEHVQLRQAARRPRGQGTGGVGQAQAGQATVLGQELVVVVEQFPGPEVQCGVYAQQHGVPALQVVGEPRVAPWGQNAIEQHLPDLGQEFGGEARVHGAARFWGRVKRIAEFLQRLRDAREVYLGRSLSDGDFRGLDGDGQHGELLSVSRCLWAAVVTRSVASPTCAGRRSPLLVATGKRP